MQDLQIKDTYKTIEISVENILYKEKNSKFFGYAYPITSELEVKKHIDQLKTDHFSDIFFLQTVAKRNRS